MEYFIVSMAEIFGVVIGFIMGWLVFNKKPESNPSEVIQRELTLALEGWQTEQAKAIQAEQKLQMISEALPLIGHPAAQRGFVPMGAFHMEDGDEHAPHETVNGQVPQ